MSSKHFPLASVVVLNYNGRKFVEQCLKSLLDTHYPNFEVLFIDNASTDDGVNVVRNLFGFDTRLKIVQNDANLGFAEGNNVGIKRSKGKYVVLLNIDTQVDPNWLAELVKLMETHPTIGAAQSKLLSLYNHKRYNCVGGLIDRYGFAYGREKIGGYQYNEVDDIFFALGAAMIIRRELLNKIGMFDREFFFYHEDVDLSWRIWLSGHRVVFAPSSIVYHAGRGITKERPLSFITTAVFFHMTKNRIVMLLKNYNRCNLMKYLPPCIVFICGRATYFVLKKEIRKAKALVEAILWNLSNFRYAWTERRKVQGIRKLSDKEIMTRKIVLNKPFLIRKFLAELVSSVC